MQLPHDRVHTGHGLAKDFGLSGLKTGWLYTTNEVTIRFLLLAPAAECLLKGG